MEWRLSASLPENGQGERHQEQVGKKESVLHLTDFGSESALSARPARVTYKG